MAGVRTQQNVVAAREEARKVLEDFGPLQPLTEVVALTLKAAETLEEAQAALATQGPPWDLVFLQEDVRDEVFGGITPLLWACGPQVPSEVMGFLLEFPGMRTRWALEAVTAGGPYEDGVPLHKNPLTGRGLTPLFACVQVLFVEEGSIPNQLAKCELLLQAGACLNARTEHGSSVLHLAVLTKLPDVVQWAVQTWVTKFPWTLHGVVDCAGRSLVYYAERVGFDHLDLLLQ
jgi:hypothetical protein